MQGPEEDKIHLAGEVRTLIDRLMGDRLVRRFDLAPLERNSFSPFNSPTLVLISNNGDESCIFIRAHHIQQHLEESRLLVFTEQYLPHIITHIHEDNQDEEGSQSRWLDQWLDKMAEVIEGKSEEASVFDLLGIKDLLVRISP